MIGRKLTKDDLISPFDTLEAQERQLKDFCQNGQQDIQTCDSEQARHREEKLKELKAERTTLATQMQDETDDAKRRVLEAQILEIDESTRAVEKNLSVDAHTRRAIAHKNPKLAIAMGWNTKPDKVIPDHAGKLARISRVIDEAVEISKQEEPRDPSATEAFDALADANRTIGKALNSQFFKMFARWAGMSPGAIKFAEQVGKTSKAVDKNVVSPMQTAIQSEGFVYATGDGMKEYIARRLKEEAISQAKESRDRLRKLMDLAARAVACSKENEKLLPSLNADIEQLQQQLRDRQRQLESLARTAIANSLWCNDSVINQSSANQETSREDVGGRDLWHGCCLCRLCRGGAGDFVSPRDRLCPQRIGESETRVSRGIIFRGLGSFGTDESDLLAGVTRRLNKHADQMASDFCRRKRVNIYICLVDGIGGPQACCGAWAGCCLANRHGRLVVRALRSGNESNGAGFVGLDSIVVL